MDRIQKTTLSFAALLIVITLALSGFGYNKQVFDTTYHFNKAYINTGDKTLYVDLKSWNEYDDEKIQVTTKEGVVYYGSSFNIILVEE